jgi:hypothetical protein
MSQGSIAGRRSLTAKAQPRLGRNKNPSQAALGMQRARENSCRFSQQGIKGAN